MHEKALVDYRNAGMQGMRDVTACLDVKVRIPFQYGMCVCSLLDQKVIKYPHANNLL